MRTENLHLIRKEVEDSFGRKIITASDCTQLSEEMSNKIGHQLNVNTLRRCFGLVKTTYPPSINTLNILSKYCGASSFSELLENKNKKIIKVGNESDTELLSYLISLFRDANVSNNNDVTFFKVVKITINFLKEDSGIITSFQKAIAKTKNGQTYYFEHFINIDKLDKFYGDGLFHYLMEKKSNDAQLLGHSLLSLRYWLTGNNEKLVHHINEVVRVGIDESIHPFICARYFAANLFHSNITGGNNEEIHSAARNYYYYAKDRFDHYMAFPNFELIMAEALILVKEFDEALFYIESGRRRRIHNIPGIVDLQLINSIEIYRAIALANTGSLKKAETIFNKLKPDEFYFLSKRFHLVLYLLLGRKFKKSKSYTEQLNHLIAETRFEKLGELVFSDTVSGNSSIKENVYL